MARRIWLQMASTLDCWHYTGADRDVSISLFAEDDWAHLVVSEWNECRLIGLCETRLAAAECLDSLRGTIHDMQLNVRLPEEQENDGEGGLS